MNLNIKILTIPKHLHRNYILLGHLETIGVPVGDMLVKGHLKFYSGFDWQNYETNADLISAMVEDGYTLWEGLLDRKKHYELPPNHAIAVEWGFLKIMKRIAEEQVPVLLLESDPFFADLRYEDILRHFSDLITMEGYENIRIAQLYFRKRENLPWAPALNDFWAKGVNGSGQVANIVTPHGAEFMLQRTSPWPTIENYMPAYPDTPGFYTAQQSQSPTRRIASLIYPHRNSNMFENYASKISGENLCENHT